MEARVEAVALFLQSLERFRTLPPDLSDAPAVAELARSCSLWGFQAGDIVAFPDERPEGLLIVAEGCLVLHSKDHADVYLGIREELDPRLPGVWKAQSAGQYVRIEASAWSAWLRAHPAVAGAWGLKPEAPLPRSLRAAPVLLEAGERVEHLLRKSPVFLVRRAGVPALFLATLAVFSALIGFPMAIFPLAGLLLSAGLVGLFVWEWRVSCLVVTDRAVLIRQVDTWERRSDFEKLALERIREATFRKQGILDAVLGLVSLELVGESTQGRLVFEGLSASSEVLAILENLRKERQGIRPTRSAIRRTLSARTGRAMEPVLLLGAGGRAPTKAPPAVRSGWRTERSGVVFFRRHPWRLTLRSLPWLGWTLLMVGIGGLGCLLVPAATGTLVALTALLVLVPVGRLAFEVADWSNDHLILDGDKIRLVHRKPLWLGEVRQEGDVGQIEQAGVRKESLAELVLDFGTVTVSLGAGPPLVFEHASHPEWIQNEIFAHRERIKTEQERRAAVERLDEVAEILDTWEEARDAGYFEPTRKA